METVRDYCSFSRTVNPAFFRQCRTTLSLKSGSVKETLMLTSMNQFAHFCSGIVTLHANTSSQTDEHRVCEPCSLRFTGYQLAAVPRATGPPVCEVSLIDKGKHKSFEQWLTRIVCLYVVEYKLEVDCKNGYTRDFSCWTTLNTILQDYIAKGTDISCFRTWDMA